MQMQKPGDNHRVFKSFCQLQLRQTHFLNQLQNIGLGGMDNALRIENLRTVRKSESTTNNPNAMQKPGDDPQVLLSEDYWFSTRSDNHAWRFFQPNQPSNQMRGQE
jgi:hypothetical protein